MLIHDMQQIGNKILIFRKKAGLTQAELAEKAGLADRTYADIERGNVNMRIETFLRICDALNVTPDTLLTEENDTLKLKQDEMNEKLSACNDKEKQTALSIINVYLNSL